MSPCTVTKIIREIVLRLKRHGLFSEVIVIVRSVEELNPH